MEQKNYTRGFTLIELMVVIAIISILALWAVRGYSQYRRLALLDLYVDSIESQVYEQRDKALFGTVNGDKVDSILSELNEGVMNEGMSESTRCYGFGFVEDAEEGFDMVLFDQEFSGKKVWNEFLGVWEQEGCVNFEERNEMVAEADPSVYLLSDEDLTRYAVRFLPPDGEAQISIDGGLGFVPREESREIIEPILRFGSSNEEIYQRKLEL
ncbi:prepilin-type N-terminal cleavage/methylation domain-containing protein [Candidatus Peregrinibacteria bacterium]|nr:prepilin-type N-terminal cleavage/methylation domain-containing protein [Candidatus Peregrinibacteria bacterium]